MTAASELKEFEYMLGRNRQHTNKQTFGADSSTPIFETINTPGVDIAGKMACLILAVSVGPDVQHAAATQLSFFRSQIAGGTQVAFLTPDDPKFVAEKHDYAPSTATGPMQKWEFPLVFSNPTKPMLIVNPHMTIGHSASNIADFAGDDIFTCFSYMVVPLSIEMHTSLLHAQMDLT